MSSKFNKLSNVADVIDSLHKTPSYSNQGKPMVRCTDVKYGKLNLSSSLKVSAKVFAEFSRRYTPKKGDIIITRVGSYGITAIVDKLDFCLGQNTSAIAPKKINPRYLYLVLNSRFIKNQIESSVVGSTQKTLSLKAINNLDIPRFETLIEDKIAKIGGNFDDKIELNTQINQTLEQIAQALFKSWFVDFDPVKAKIAVLEAGGTAEAAELAAMGTIAAKSPEQLADMQQSQPEAYQQLTQTAALFPAAMQDSELGKIPEGWTVKAFRNLLEKTIGGDWGKEAPDEKHTEKVRILRGTDLPNAHGGNYSNVPVRYVEKRKLATRQLQNGDIVIEVSGGSPIQPTGRSLFISQKILGGLIEPTEPASFCRLFRPLNADLGLFLACHLAKIYSDGKTWLYQNQSTGISNFQTRAFLEKELIVTPNIDVMDIFIRNVMSIFDKIHNGENNKLISLRDALLPELLAGSILTPNVE